MKFRVYLNGTDINPYHRFGCNQNPFPQVAKYEYDKYLLHLAKLEGDSIPDTDYIRKHLVGWSDEFIELCCQQFKKGEMVEFDVEFPD